MKENAARRNWT